MATTAARKKYATIDDVMARVGYVPLDRVRMDPTPGTATASDLLDPALTRGRPCELVGGILVEKDMGFRADLLGIWIGHLLLNFLEEHNLGAVSGPQGTIRFNPDLVRIPDVAFIRWDSVDDPNEIENPPGAFLEYPPDLAVEVLSPGNTSKEMAIKLDEYARAGVKLVWYVDPERREVDVYPKGRAKGKKTVGEGGTLDGGKVLPGFTLPVADIFKSRAPAKKPGRRGRG